MQEAGFQVAEKYGGQFRVTIEQLLRWPESGAPRPHLGEDVRIAVVSPYVLIYQYRQGDDTLVLLRVLHGRRNITERLLRRR